MNRKVMITGASRGIGKATTEIFAAHGYDLILIARDIERLNMVKNSLCCHNVSVTTISCDVSDPSSIDNLFAHLAAEKLLPDILVNNAGISYIGLIQDMSYEAWQKVINTNLSSMFYMSRQVVPHMLSNGGGKIINISSMWGNVGASCEVAYSASKGGVNAFTRALAKELAPSNIQVNAIAFGCVDTEMNAFLNEKDRQNLIDEIPAGKFCSAESAAEIVYSVATMNDYVTGQIITADGGLT